jgi:hypothetical protein
LSSSKLFTKILFQIVPIGIPKSFSMSFFLSPMAFFSALTSALSQIQFSFSIEFSSLFITNSISPHSQRWFYIRTVVSITISNVSQYIGLLGELGQQQMFTGFQKKKVCIYRLINFVQWVHFYSWKLRLKKVSDILLFQPGNCMINGVCFKVYLFINIFGNCWLTVYFFVLSFLGFSMI